MDLGSGMGARSATRLLTPLRAVSIAAVVFLGWVPQLDADGRIVLDMQTTLQPGVRHGFVVGPSAEERGYVVEVSPLEAPAGGGHVYPAEVRPEFNGTLWQDVLRVGIPSLPKDLSVSIRVYAVTGKLFTEFNTELQPGVHHGFLVDPTSNGRSFVVDVTPTEPSLNGASIEVAEIKPEFNGVSWNNVLRAGIPVADPPLGVNVRIYDTSYLPVFQSFETELSPGTWHGFLIGSSMDEAGSLPHVEPLEPSSNGARIDQIVVQQEFDGTAWNDVLRVQIPADEPALMVRVTIQEVVGGLFADGFETGSTARWSKVMGNLDYWPNSVSRANSDFWISANHDQIRVMRPKVLVLVFMNNWHGEVEKTESLIDSLELSTTYHGHSDDTAPSFFQYEVAKYVDLRDPDGTITPDGNSTKYPRVPNWTGGNNFAYEQLYTEEFAELFGFEDPDHANEYLTLEELLGAGTIHEVWFFAYHGAFGAPYETIEIKQYYDANHQKIPGTYGAAGNGHYPFLPWTGRSLRFTFINGERGIGCALENFGHALEGMARYQFSPYWRSHFYEFAGFDLDTRWGLPINSFYAGGDGSNDYPKPDQLDWSWLGQSGTVDDFFAVGGNVHFIPSGRGHYDLDNTQQVFSTIEHYRLFDGPGGEDQQELWDRSSFTDYYSVAPDCMGPWLVYWRMNMPGLDNRATDMNQEAMKNWWPFLFY